ncbi:MAG: cobalamin transport system substrate-binding protein [Actinomycetota bacterium]|nr:cobalamin transport system substrate-binding protein [Actinomycetota bacterium]
MHKLLAVLTVSALALVGCGSSTTHTAASTTSTAVTASFPVQIGNVTIATRPKRIVSLSATATEMVYAVGAGTQVAAVDKYSTYPKAAPHTGLDPFGISAEAVSAETPDLVLLSDDTDGKLAAGLATLKIPALLLPAAKTLDESYAQIREIGRATGHVAGATTEVTRIRSALDAVVKSIGGRAKGLSYYHELDNTFYSATSKTFIGEVYARLGMVNIADATASAATGNYPQLSAEYIISKDPDFVFLADTICCHQDAKTFAARPGFSGLKAVRNGHIVALSDDLASHWGPRIVDFMRAVGAAIEGKSSPTTA